MKRRYIAAGAALIIVVLLGVIFLPRLGMIRAAGVEKRVRAAVTRAETPAQTSGEGYVSPVDFAALRAGNSDIYAWLYIPGAGVNEPLLRREDDSTYYAEHNSLGGADSVGALFTDAKYSAKDFSGPATVIYGKNNWEGRLFDGLQAAYSSDSGLRENSEMIVYLPEEELHYTAFAAAPFRSYDITYYFHFNVPGRFQTFLDLIRSVRTVDSHWNDEAEAAIGDQLLILSVPRSGNTSYLVLAKRS